MSDPIEVALGGGAVAAVVWGLLKWSGNRNVSSIDESLKDIKSTLHLMSTALAEQGTRATKLEKDVDQLKKESARASERIDGQGNSWREQFEQVRTGHHTGMTRATEMMNQSTASLVTAIGALAKAEATLAAATLTKTEPLLTGRRRQR